MKNFLAISVIALAPLALAPLAYGQELKLEVFDRLKDKAKDKVDLNLPKNLIELASGILGVSSDDDVAKLKKLVQGLSNILVKSLEFDKEGMFTDADVNQLIAEMGAPGWNLVISADERKERSRIWIKSGAKGELGGLRIVSSEPKELTVVQIVGNIRPEDLKELGGLGVPDVLSEHGKSSGNKKDE